MSVSQKNAVQIASMASGSMRVAQLAVTPKGTMADIHTRKESWSQNTIHAMLNSVRCATSGKRKVTMGASNMKAMREALVEIDELTNLLDIPEDKKNPLLSPSHSFVAVKMRKIIKKALEEPARNCDVGTPKEQQGRFLKFCDSHTSCPSCPATKVHAHCELVWAQMPYEEGGAK